MNTVSSAKICMLRFSALGDLSHVVPLIWALHQHSPDSQIDWIIDPKAQALIPDIPGLRLIPFNKNHGWRGLQNLRRTLNGQRYDKLLLLQTSARANLISTVIKAKRRIGWDSARAREGQALVKNARIEEAPPQHQVQGFLAFARHLGVAVNEPYWGLSINVDAAGFAAQNLPGDQPTLVISPCSSHSLRNWQPQRYAQVADWVQRTHGWRVAIIGGPSNIEQSMALSIEQHAKAPIVNLVGKDTLPQMLALLDRANVVMAPDSGPLHWANALGKPVVGLYAATWSQRSGPYNSLDLCVDHFAEAANKYRRCEPENLRWGTRIEQPGVMELVGVDEVCEKLTLAIERQSHSQ